MAEVVGIVAAIGSLIKTVGHTYLLIEDMKNAPQDVKDIVSQLGATEAVLKSLMATLNAVKREEQFLWDWNDSLTIALAYVENIVAQLQRNLGIEDGQAPKLTPWKKFTWSLEKDEIRRLQIHLQAAMQALHITSAAFLNGTTNSARRLYRDIDDTLSSVEPLLATIIRPSTPRSGLSSPVLAPDDSASQFGFDSSKLSPDLKSTEKQHERGRRLRRSWSGFFKSQRSSQSPFAPSSKEKQFSIEVETLKVRKNGLREPESLGSGKIQFSFDKERTRLWIVFKSRHKDLKDHRGQWYKLSPPTPPQNIETCPACNAESIRWPEALEKEEVSIYMQGCSTEHESGADDELLLVFKCQDDKNQCDEAMAKIRDIMVDEQKHREETDAMKRYAALGGATP